MSEEWCDLCDLPLATCVHGMPPPPKVEPKPTPAPRTRRASTPKAPRAAKPAGVVVRQTARRQTPPASYRSHILAVLDEHEGSCPADVLLDAVHERMADVLLEGDEELVGAGEARWRLAVRRERAAMTDDGLLRAARTPGVWELADTRG